MFRKGRRRVSGGVTVITASGLSGQTRVGFVAGRRVGTAVARNRAKRRLREAMARIAVPSDVDCILLASAEVNRAPFEQLVGWLVEAFDGDGAAGPGVVRSRRTE